MFTPPIGPFHGMSEMEIAIEVPIIAQISGELSCSTESTVQVALLNALALISFPAAKHLFPLFIILLAPVIDRQQIPAVKTVENIGRRAYGIYFMNLIVLDLLLLALTALFPGVFYYYWLILPPLFLLTLLIPLGVMKLVERIQNPPIYRYVFG